MIDLLNEVRNFRSQRFRIIKGCDLNRDEILRTLKQEYNLVNASEGEYSVVEETNQVDNHFYDNSKSTGFFDTHIDGPYYEKAPNYGLLFCEQLGAKDIPTFLVDSKTAFESLSVDDQEIIKKLDIQYFSSNGEQCLIPYIIENPFIINHVTRGYLLPKRNLSRKEIPSVSHYLKAVSKLMYLFDKKLYTHKWEKGDILLWNNRTLLHGRGEVEAINNQIDCSRVLVRYWFNDKTEDIYRKRKMEVRPRTYDK